MNNLWLVAQREITVHGRTKGFLVGLVISAVLVAVVAFIPKFFSGPDLYTVGLVNSPGIQPVATSIAATEEVTLDFTDLPDERAARTAVEEGDVDVAVVDGTTILADGRVPGQLGSILQSAHRTVQAEKRLREAGLDPARVTEAMNVPPLAEVSIDPADDSAALRIGAATLMVFVLFFLLMSSITSVAMGVVEEKGSRIVELLLTSIRPWQLLGGKILGLGLLGLINFVVVLGAGIVASVAAGTIDDLPPGMGGTILGALGWFLLGYAFFATLAASLGALVSRQEEVNSVLTPLTTLLLGAYLVAFSAVIDPGSTLARILSLVPPFSSMVMPVRMAGGQVPVWEVVLAALLMLLAVLVVLRVGAGIYRRAVLRTGARVRLGEVIRGTSIGS